MQIPYKGLLPVLGKNVFVAEGAKLIGEVNLGDDSAVLFNAVLRADINHVRLGRCSNVQDNSTLHVASDLGVDIGDYVSIGHNCVVHACKIHDRVLVGMGAIVMDGCVVESDCIIAAGSLLTKGKHFPSGSLIMGNPAKLVRNLSEEEKQSILHLAIKYVGVKNSYLELPS